MLTKIAGMILCLTVSLAIADDRNPFYKDKLIPGTQVPCCNKRDCVVAQNWRYRDKKYEVFVRGRWMIPNQKVVTLIQTPDGNAHVCYTVVPTASYMPSRVVIYCVWIPLSLI